MTGEYITDTIETLKAIGQFIKDPGAHVVAVFSFFVVTPITFLATQTVKRLKLQATGTQWPAHRIQICSWAWYVIINLLIQVIAYWGTSSQVPWNIYIVTTIIGVVCYLGVVEWWIAKLKANFPEVWKNIRTDRRTTITATPGDITSDNIPATDHTTL
jgi:hypothetical protein